MWLRCRAMRHTAAALVMFVFVAACSSSEEPVTSTTTAAPGGPRETVAAWIDAVIASDAQALTGLVEPVGLVMLAAVENRFTNEEIAALLGEGLSMDLIDEYWTSFRRGFADFAGVPIQSIEVGGHQEFMLGEVPFASIVIMSGDGVTSVMTSKRGERWRLDLIGSFGTAFAAQLRRMLVNLPDTPAANTIRDAFRSDIVPGLLAALRRAPGNRLLSGELERMALLLEQR